MGLVIWVVSLVLGASFHVLKVFTWYGVGFGLMGCVLMCVLVMRFRIWCSTIHRLYTKV